jgi:hypothetical protein
MKRLFRAALSVAAVVMVLPAAALPALGITGGEVDTTHTKMSVSSASRPSMVAFAVRAR